eukprot:TRINITY_DN591_c0_g1_i4.p1 TRINITY_DN591_c0_g1~~TRINITY_DN591_c0_g1_i4.p1  ORF type:complete len:887 (+),score=143.98 TRINITY_DN591_c0_g1_i4:59-2719(+)
MSSDQEKEELSTTWTAVKCEELSNGILVHFDEKAANRFPGAFIRIRKLGDEGSFDAFSMASTVGEDAVVYFSSRRRFTIKHREYLLSENAKFEVMKQPGGGSPIARSAESRACFVFNCGVTPLALVPLASIIRWDVPTEMRIPIMLWFVHAREELTTVHELLENQPPSQAKRSPEIRIILSGKHGDFEEMKVEAKKIPGAEVVTECEGINKVIPMIMDVIKKEEDGKVVIETIGSKELHGDLKKKIAEESMLDVTFGNQAAFGFPEMSRSSWIDYQNHNATAWLFPFSFSPFKWGDNFPVQDWMFLQTDPLPLAIFRILFGYLMFDYALKTITEGKADRAYVHTDMRFKYDYMEWLGPDLEAPYCYYVYYAMGLSSIGIGLGWPYRLSSLVFTITFVWHFFVEATHYNNHYYLIACLGLLFLTTRADACLKFDPVRIIRNRLKPKVDADGEKIKPDENENQVPHMSYYSHFIFRGFVLFVFFYGFFAKINNDWCSGHTMRAGFDDQELPWLASELLVFFLTWGGLVFDMVGPLYLCYSPLRTMSVLGFIFFNTCNMILFTIGVFPWMMLGCIPILVDTHQPRDFIRWNCDRLEAAGRSKKFILPAAMKSVEGKVRAVLSRWASWVKIVLPAHRDQIYQNYLHSTWYSQPAGTFRVEQPVLKSSKPAWFRFGATFFLFLVIIIECVYPFRSHYYHYGSNQQVAWTEHGRKFSWHMMSRHKLCSGNLTVTLGDDFVGNFTIPDSKNFGNYKGPIALNSHQVKKLGLLATYVRQYCWKLRGKLQQTMLANGKLEGIDISDRTEDIVDHTKAIKVYADIWCSVNGSPKQPFLDPSYDLSRALPPAVMGDREPWILEQTQFGTEGYASIWPAKTKEELARARGEVVEDDKN